MMPYYSVSDSNLDMFDKTIQCQLIIIFRATSHRTKSLKYMYS